MFPLKGTVKQAKALLTDLGVSRVNSVHKGERKKAAYVLLDMEAARRVVKAQRRIFILDDPIAYDARQGYLVCISWVT
ncbi:hypothetical protein NUSPORA_02157 [Nucleospora cyclopteri]